MNRQTNLIWIDLEMTGLSIEKERIIEIATLVTDQHLNEIAAGPVRVIHQPESILSAMHEWCVVQHGKTGLTDQVRKSEITEQAAEDETLAFLQEYVDPQASPMCGNTICMDRRFLARYMPRLEAFFHYRHLDVSTIKELAKRWKPEVYDGLKKPDAHRALDDIRASIDELKYYREHWLK